MLCDQVAGATEDRGLLGVGQRCPLALSVDASVLDDLVQH
jgi:hypothetical protein